MIYMENMINSQVQRILPFKIIIYNIHTCTDGYLSTPIQAVDRSMENTMCVVGKLE